MNAKFVFVALVSTAAACGPKSSVHTTATRPSAPAERVLAVADAFIDDELEHDPDEVALLRPPGARYDHLPDDSLPAVHAREAREDQWLRELEAMPHDLTDERARLAYEITTESLRATAAARPCHLELFNVSQVMTGWQVRYAVLADAQPVGTADLRAQALHRFTELPRWVDAHIDNLREGLKLGYVAAKITVPLVIEQLDTLARLPPRESPFFSPAARDGDAAFQSAFEKLLEERITPAIRKYRDFLANEYLPKARTSPSVSQNPSGVACYRALIRLDTTLDIDPAKVHEIGRRELAAIESEMKALSEKSFGAVPVKQLLERFREDPAYRYRDKKEIVAQAESTLARARTAMPKIVHRLPKGAVTVEPIPAFQEKTSPAHYLAAALDGSRPAAYRIRLYQPDKQNRVAGESVAFHETIPGHHLQIALANERTENPRVARFHWVPSFGEGWALYAERLADELGLYTSDVDRFGMLSSAAFRATRLIVDTGIHALGWSRERAIDELLTHTAMSPDAAAAEIDRYIAWPGQATSYMLGYLEIASLRREAEAALGARFDRRDFHEAVLEEGPVPLPVLRRHVERWLSKRASPR